MSGIMRLKLAPSPGWPVCTFTVYTSININIIIMNVAAAAAVVVEQDNKQEFVCKS